MATAVWLGLAGCAAPVTEPVVKPYTTEAVGLTTQPTGEFPPSAWWQAVGDASLDRLVAQALAHNPGWMEAQARMRQALAAVPLLQASVGPQGSLEMAAKRQHYSENGLMPAPLAGSARTTGNVTAALQWELDTAGVHAAELAAAVGRARAAQADEAVARVALTTQVVRVYVAWSGAQAQWQVARDLLAQRRALVAVAQARFKAGLDGQAELQRLAAGVSEAQMDLESAQAECAALRRQVAALVGLPPHGLDALEPTAWRQLEVPALTPDMSVQLLGRRPEIVAARWRVEAASQTVKADAGRFLPNLRLSAFVGWQSLGLDRLLDMGSREWGVGPVLSLPVFDSDRLTARWQGSRAALDESVAHYNTVLLQAVHQVADAWQTGTALQRQRQEQTQALALSEAAWRLAAERYGAGLGNVLPVLEAESRVLWHRRLSHELWVRQWHNRLDLIRALGGGWAESQGSSAV